MLFVVETLPYIGFHTLSLMNSTYLSTIWDKSSASYARTLANNSVSVHMLPVSGLKYNHICGGGGVFLNYNNTTPTKLFCFVLLVGSTVVTTGKCVG
jgi:hypothetical protein